MKSTLHSTTRPERFSLLRFIVASLLSAAMLFTPVFGVLPSGGSVTSGEASISYGDTSVDVSSETVKTIIDWQGFSVGEGFSANFAQPGSASAVLNRVTSGAASEIYGTLSSNGQVFLINPNGVLIGSSGVVDTAGFVASTLDVADSAFLAGEDLTFSGSSDATVVNLGSIGVGSGDVFLIAQAVANAGSISGGTVGLAAGNSVLLASSGDERIFVDPAAAYSVDGTGVDNSGLIEAVSSELKAAGNVYSLAINNSGSLKANTAIAEGGRILLKTDGAANVDGTISTGVDGSFVVRAEALGSDFRVTESLGGTFVYDPDDLIVDSPASLPAADPLTVTAASVESSLNVPGALVVLEANLSITVSEAIDSSTGLGGGATLLLADENSDDSLVITLNAPITLRSDQLLQGEGTTVTTGAAGNAQNAIDVALFNAGTTVDFSAIAAESTVVLPLGFVYGSITGSATDNIQGPDTPNTWTMDGGNEDINGTTLIGFDEFIAGTGGDFFDVDGNSARVVTGGAGLDTVDVAGLGGTTVTFNGTVTGGLTATSNIETFVGAGAGDTFAGTAADETFQVFNTDTGTFTNGTTTVNFQNFGDLDGGDGADTFSFAAGTIDNVDGGAGTDTLNFSLAGNVTVPLAGSAVTGVIDTGFTNSEVIIGNGVSSVLTGEAATNETFNITGTNSGTLGAASTGGVTTFTNFGEINAGTGDDTFVFSGSGNIFDIDGEGGTDVINLDALSSATVNLQNDTITSRVISQFAGVETIIGDDSGADDISFVVIGTTGADEFDLSGVNEFTYAADSVDFEDFGTINGGAGADTLDVAAASIESFVGGAGTDIIDLADLADEDVNLATSSTSTAVASFASVETFIGATGATAQITAPTGNNTITLIGNEDGTINTVTFQDFGTVNGNSGADTFVAALGGNIFTYTITGAGGSDTFNASTAVTDTDLNLQVNTIGTADGDLVTYADGTIETFIGRSNATTNTMTFADAGGTVVLTDTNEGTYTDGTDVISFENFGALVGGDADDSITFSGGSLSSGAAADIDFVSGGTPGADSVTINYALGNPGDVVIAGDGTDDTLTISGGTTTTSTLDVDGDGDFTLGKVGGTAAGTITATDVYALNDSITTTNRVFTDSGGAMTGVFTAPADDIVFTESGISTTADLVATVSVPTGGITVNGAAGADTITITALPDTATSVFTGDLTIDGGADTDSVTITELPSVNGNIADFDLTSDTDTINTFETTGSIVLTSATSLTLATDTALTADDDDITIDGAGTLIGGTALTLDAGRGDILITTGATTLDGFTVVAADVLDIDSAITVTAGNIDITADDIDLDADLETATSGTIEVTTSDDDGELNIFDTGTLIGVDGLTLNGEGSVVTEGGSELDITDGNMSITVPVDLGGAIIIGVDGGAVSNLTVTQDITSTDVDDADITITADATSNVTFLGDILLDDNGNDKGDLSLDQGDTISFRDLTLTDLTISDATTSINLLGTTTADGNVVLASPALGNINIQGLLDVDGTIDVDSGGALNLTAAIDGESTVSLDSTGAFAITRNGNIDAAGAVTIQTALDGALTTAGDITTSADAVTIGNAGFGGVTLDDDISIATSGGAVEFDTADADIDSAGNDLFINAGAADVIFDGDYSGGGLLVVAGDNVTLNTDTNGFVTDGLNITATAAVDIDQALDSNDGGVTISAAGAIDISAGITDADDVSITSTGSTVNINTAAFTGIDGTVAISGDTSVTFDAAADVTAGDTITITGATTTATDFTTTDNNGDIVLNDDVTLTGAIDYGADGDILFEGDIAAAGNAITLDAPGTVRFGSSETVTGDIDTAGALTIGATVAPLNIIIWGETTADTVALTADNQVTIFGDVTTDTTGITVNSDETRLDSVSLLAAADQAVAFNTDVDLTGGDSSVTASGTGTIDFNGAITSSEVTASSNPARNLTVTAATGTVTFADTIGLGFGNELGILDVNTTSGNIVVSELVEAASLDFDSSGTADVSLSNNITTTSAAGVDIQTADGNLDINGIVIDTTAGAGVFATNTAVDINADTIVRAGGDITFGNLLDGDGDADDLTLSTPANIAFNGIVGATPLGELLIITAGDVTSAAGATIAVGTFDQRAGTGTTTLGNTLTTTDADGIDITTTALSLANTLTATGGSIDITAPVTITAAVELDADDDINVNGTIDGTFALTLDSTDNITITGALGSNAAIGAITLDTAEDVTFESSIDAASLTVTTIEAGNDLTFLGDVASTGALDIDVADATVDIVFDGVDVTATTIDIDDGDVDIQNGVSFTGTTIDFNTNGGHLISSGTDSPASDLTVTATDAVNFDDVGLGANNELGDVAVSGTSTIDFNGTVEASSLDIDSTGGAITFDEDVTVTGALGVDLESGGNGVTLDGLTMTSVNANGSIAINEDLTLSTGAVELSSQEDITVTGATDGAVAFTVSAEDDIAFNGNVGATITSMTITTADDVDFDGTVSIAGPLTQNSGTGTTTFDSTLTTTAGGAISVATNNITTTGVVTSAAATTFTNSGVLDIDAAVNSTGAFTQNGIGNVELGGTITTTDTAILFASPIELTADVSLLSGAGDITVQDTIDGFFDLTVTNTAAGDNSVQLLGAIGAGPSTPLDDVTITTVGDIDLPEIRTNDGDVSVTVTTSEILLTGDIITNQDTPSGTGIGGAVTLNAGAVDTDATITFEDGADVTIDTSTTISGTAAGAITLTTDTLNLNDGNILMLNVDTPTTDLTLNAANTQTFTAENTINTGGGDLAVNIVESAETGQNINIGDPADPTEPSPNIVTWSDAGDGDITLTLTDADGGDINVNTGLSISGDVTLTLSNEADDILISGILESTNVGDTLTVVLDTDTLGGDDIVISERIETRGGNVTINAESRVVQNGGDIITGGGDITLTAGADTNVGTNFLQTAGTFVTSGGNVDVDIAAGGIILGGPSVTGINTGGGTLDLTVVDGAILVSERTTLNSGGGDITVETTTDGDIEIRGDQGAAIRGGDGITTISTVDGTILIRSSILMEDSGSIIVDSNDDDGDGDDVQIGSLITKAGFLETETGDITITSEDDIVIQGLARNQALQREEELGVIHTQSGDISVTADDNLFIFASIKATEAGGDISLTADNVAGGNGTLQIGGAASVGQVEITTAEVGGGGDITILNANNTSNSAVTIIGGVGTSTLVEARGSGGDLDIQSEGGILIQGGSDDDAFVYLGAQNDTLLAAAADIFAVGGTADGADVMVTNTSNNASTIDITAGEDIVFQNNTGGAYIGGIGGTIGNENEGNTDVTIAAAGDVRLANDLDLGIEGDGDLIIASDASFGATGTVVAGTAAGGGSLALGNSIDGIEITTGSGDLRLYGEETLVSTLPATIGVGLVSTGGVVELGDYDAGKAYNGIATVALTGDFGTGVSNVFFNEVSSISGATGSVRIDADTDVTFSELFAMSQDSPITLDVDAGDDIIVSGNGRFETNVGGSLDFDAAGGDITIGGTRVSLLGEDTAVALTADGDLNVDRAIILDGDGSVDIDANNGDVLFRQVVTGGSVTTFAGDINIAGDSGVLLNSGDLDGNAVKDIAVLTNSGDIIITAANGPVGILSSVIAGGAGSDITITADSDIDIGDGIALTRVRSTGGEVSMTATNGTIIMAEADVDTVDGVITIFADGDIVLSDLQTSGDATVTADNGGITQASIIDVSTLTLDADSDITLDDTSDANSVDTLIVTAGGDVDISLTSGVVLGAVNITGDFILNADGDVAQDSTLTVTGGDLTIITDGNVTIDETSGAIAGVANVTITASNAIIDYSAALDIVSADVADDLTIDIGGNALSDSGEVNVGSTLTVTAGSITLDTFNNTVDEFSAATTGDISLTVDSGLKLGDVDANGGAADFTLNAQGTVEQNSTATTFSIDEFNVDTNGGSLQIADTNSITDIATLDLTDVGNAVVEITNAAFVVTGGGVSGSLNVVNSGSIDVDAAFATAGDIILRSETSSVAFAGTGAGATDGNLSITAATDATIDGITEINNGNLFVLAQAGNISVTAGILVTGNSASFNAQSGSVTFGAVTEYENAVNVQAQGDIAINSTLTIGGAGIFRSIGGSVTGENNIDGNFEVEE